MTKIRLKYVHQYRDARGRMWRYVRRPGMPEVRLPGMVGSPEFMQAYASAVDGIAPVPRGYNTGTVGKLVEDFYRTPEFANLAVKSQSLYRRVLIKFVKAHGQRKVGDLPEEKATKIIEGIGARRPGMANLTRSVLSTLFKFAIKKKMRAKGDNPFRDMVSYKLGTRHTWTDEELAIYEKRWPLGTRERLAYAVLLYSAQRVSDAARFRRGDVLSITQQKTGTELTIPIHPALARAIAAGPSKGVYLIGDEEGRPITGEALSKLITRAVGLAGLPKECVAHGLRKAALRRLAENSATTKGIAAVSGHKTLGEIERYTAKANQTRLAATAMALIPDEEGTGTG